MWMASNMRRWFLGPRDKSLNSRNSFESFHDGFLRLVPNALPIAVMSPNLSTAEIVARWIEELGSLSMIITDGSPNEDWLSSRRNRISCFIFDSEMMRRNHLEECAEMSRRVLTNTGLILASEDIGRANFSPSRSRPWHVEIGKPFREVSFKLAIISAISNAQMDSPEPEKAHHHHLPIRSCDTKSGERKNLHKRDGADEALVPIGSPATRSTRK